MKNAFIHIALCFCSWSLWCQNGYISGIITDTSGAALPFVNIGIIGTSLGQSTNPKGMFTIGPVAVGTYQLAVSSLGYESQIQQVVVLEGQSNHLQFRLMAINTFLQSVEILGRQSQGYTNESSFAANKTATLVKDIPQSISIVTKELILDQAAFRLNDVVKNMSGVNQFSFYNDISIRGFRVQGQGNSGNLVNGMRAFTSFWKQQLIPHIETVEVIKGPTSSMFGNASPGGTINRVTKKPLESSHQSVTTTLGSFNTFRMFADFTGAMTEDKKLLYRINLGYENSGNFRDLQFDKNIVVAPSFSFRPSTKTNINVDIVYQGSNGRLDRGQAVFGNGDLFSVPISRSLNAANDFLKEENINTTISFRHQFSSKLSFNSVFQRSSYSEDLLEHRTANTFATKADGSRDPEKMEMRVFIRNRKWNNNGLNNYLSFETTTGDINHKLLVGHDYFIQSQELGGSQLQARGYLSADRTRVFNSFNPANAANYSLDATGNPIPNVPHFDLTDPSANRLRDMTKYIYAVDLFNPFELSSHGVYLQDQLSLGKMDILLGLRQDYFVDYENFGTEDETKVTQHALLPRLGITYKINSALNVYGSYVQGYQPQTSSAINDPNAGGPFDPLLSNLWEVGAKGDWFNGRLSTTLAVYQITEKGALYNANDPTNPDRLEQIGEEQAKGFEFDIVGRLSRQLNVTLSYAFNQAIITAADDQSVVGRQKPNAPRHTGNVWAKYSISGGVLNGLGFGLGSNFVTERFGSIVPRGQQPQAFPAYNIVDVALYYNLNRFQIQFNINNALNTTHWVGGYDYIRAFPGAPRQLLTTISYTF